MAKFNSVREFRADATTVEMGTRAGAPTVKVILAAGSAFIMSVEEAERLADALDEGLDAFDTDPMLWGDPPQ